ncbi:hypothetical protein L873DRAFT_1796508 [Choiromyces venosus 120613-1]|uniref:Uncharacterized protein n=1 Tax=Choiromyces venosus 120613-1 TaxID=1336337 RepID=A0A3N4ITN3_9PEZI|nr:hypothetical protein L873DRAFT_1796508 [Choiromyces venosus 120613-1]
MNHHLAIHHGATFAAIEDSTFHILLTYILTCVSHPDALHNAKIEYNNYELDPISISKVNYSNEEILLKVLDHYQITPKFGYITTDNASNNDSSLVELAPLLAICNI